MIIISETDPRFYIKDSSIEGAGSGVFSQKKNTKRQLFRDNRSNG